MLTLGFVCLGLLLILMAASGAVAYLITGPTVETDEMPDNS